MPRTPLSFITTGMRFISWVPADEDVIRLSFRCVVRNGIRRFQIADPSNDPDRLRRLARMAREEGVEEIVIGLTYSVSPVHTHEYYAERAAALAGCAEMDRLYLKDPGGLLTQSAVRELAPHFLRAAGDRTVELHSHCTIGLAPFVYIEGAAGGLPGAAHGRRAARARHVQSGGRDDAPRPRGRGLLAPARSARRSQRLRALPRARRATRACRSGSRRSSTPPTTTTSSRAAWSRRRGGCWTSSAGPSSSRRVLEEVGRVRAEMGYPIIVTPVSQLVATQAVRNVIDGERWSTVSDETVRYFLGHYGEPAAPVDPDVADARALAAAHRGAAQARAAAPRGRARALRQPDLRRGAAAPADDARGAGGRDARLGARGASAARAAGSGAGRDAAAGGGEAPRDHARCACGRATSSWSGAVRLRDVEGFVLDIDGTLVHRAGDVAHVEPGARERAASGSGPRAGGSSCSRTAATRRPRRSRPDSGPWASPSTTTTS